MTDNELAFASASRLSAMLEAHEVSSLELTELFLERIGRINPQINAYLTVSGDVAVARVRVGRQFAEGQRGVVLACRIEGLADAEERLEAVFLQQHGVVVRPAPYAIPCFTHSASASASPISFVVSC